MNIRSRRGKGWHLVDIVYDWDEHTTPYQYVKNKEEAFETSSYVEASTVKRFLVLCSDLVTCLHSDILLPLPSSRASQRTDEQARDSCDHATSGDHVRMPLT